MAKKKKKKKAGCLGTFVNFLITLVCLVFTGLIFYLVYIVVSADGPVDPKAEFMALPEKLMQLWEWIMNKVQGAEASGAEPSADPESTPATEADAN